MNKVNVKTVIAIAAVILSLTGCSATAAPEPTPSETLLSELETCKQTLDASIEFQSAAGDASTESATLAALRIYVLRTDNIANQSKEPLRSQLILRAGPFRNPDFEKGFVVTDEEQEAKDAFDAHCKTLGVSLNVN
ncbi:MAG: hypothetical protein RLZZ340_110 [Actinomycetota bacterium]|jgi:hypothetical protein